MWLSELFVGRGQNIAEHYLLLTVAKISLTHASHSISMHAKLTMPIIAFYEKKFLRQVKR